MELKKLKELDVLSAMDNADLKSLSAQIREYIIEYTSKNGGYLSSNLSCVDIGLVLKKLFIEKDQILLCGEDLELLNRYLELSDKDVRLTSLSSCLGEVISRDERHEDNNIVCLVNSDYLRSGKAIESLNQIGAEKRKMIIVFNDDTTINQGIGLVDRFISTLRNTKAYNNIKTNVKGAISSNKNGDKLIEDIHNIKSTIKKSMIHEGIFGEYDIDYIGPVDGHNIAELTRALEIAKSKKYPVVVHCITTNGKGFKLAESNTNGAWKKVDRFDVKTGKNYAGETDGYLFPKHILSNELNKAMMTNENIMVISNNIYQDGVSLLFAQYVNRCILTSSNAVSLEMICGLSQSKMYPYTCLFSSEIKDCFDQLYSFVNKINSPLLISVIDDESEDMKLLKYLNNISLYKASSEEEIKKAVHDFPNADKPTVIIIPKTCIESK